MTNEAKERRDQVDWYLRGALIGYDVPTGNRVRNGAMAHVDEALAAERRATVERIRERIENMEPMTWRDTAWVEWHEAVAILDEEGSK